MIDAILAVMENFCAFSLDVPFALVPSFILQRLQLHVYLTFDIIPDDVYIFYIFSVIQFGPF